MLEKLLLASIVTLCLNLLVVVSLSNNQNNTTTPLAEHITTGKKWLAPIGSNWQQYQLSPLTAK